MMDWQDVDMREQRRHFGRRPVRLQARLRVGEMEIAAWMENISPGGAFVNVALPEDTRVVIASIRLPQGKALYVRARVCWRRGQPPGVGLAFESFLEGPADEEA
jgi:hypothetical protein